MKTIQPIQVGVYDEFAPCQCQNKTMKKRTIVMRELDTAYPIASVNIVNLTTQQGTISDAQGKYTLQASANDKIRFSHVATEPIEMLYKDLPDVLEMKPVIELTEVVVTAPSYNEKIKKSINWFWWGVAGVATFATISIFRPKPSKKVNM